MSKIKYLVYSVPGAIAAALFALVAKADTIDTAITDAVATGTARLGSILTSNLGTLFGLGIAIIAIFFMFRLFKRFIGSR